MLDRFWSKCSEPDHNGCIRWKEGHAHKGGYGMFFYRGSMKVAHRYAWELANGPIPAGKQVNHKCDVRNCVNPEHLYLGTQMDNMRDMCERGRNRKPSRYGERNNAAKLTEERVKEIRAIGRARPQREVARSYGVSQMIISKILRRIVWSHV